MICNLYKSLLWRWKLPFAVLLVTFVALVSPQQLAAQGAFDVFFDAVKRGDRDAVALYLRRGMDPNSVDAEGTPAIVLAARQQAWGVVELLAAHRRVDVNLRGPAGESALMLAAFAGRVDLMAQLRERGAELNSPGWTALHYAATNGHLQAIEWLLERAAYIDAVSPNGTTPLMMAARHQQIDAVRLLVERGADPTLRNQAGYAAADYLWANGQDELAGWMRERAEAFDRQYRRGIK